MNRASTLQLLGKRFTILSEIGSDVVRAERQHNGEPIGVFYFDFSDTITRPEFDVRGYAQKLVASDFYKHEGSLQWNYYIYFVLDKQEFQKIHGTPKAVTIEADRVFARKFIRDQETLNAELTQPLADILHTTRPSEDIASRWVRELNEAGLNRITDPAAEYDPAVREYLSGGPKTPRSTSTKPAASVPDGRFIRRLQLVHFRTHPEKKDFEFGTVNLMRGVNGTGKTSLLEGIELCICGGNRRQGGRSATGAKLQIEFIGKKQLENFPGISAAQYRDRDLAWYGGYYRTGNQLCQNFGRFNFFDSDAAFQLSSATNGADILKAINALLLGEFATTIEERMHRFQDRFASEERDLQRRMLIRRQEAAKVSQQIEQLKTIKDTRDALLRELQGKAEACRWRKLPARFKLDDLAVLQEAAEESATRLNQHVSRLSWLGRVSIDSVGREIKQFDEALNEIPHQQDLAKKNSAAWERTKSRLAEVEDDVKNLRHLQEYHVQLDAFLLLGSSAAIKEMKIKVAQLKEAVTLLRNVNLEKFKGYASTLDEVAANQEVDMAKRRRNLARLKSHAADLQTKSDMIKTVVEQIKGLGSRFCEISPKSTDCPLCGAHYDRLSDRISSLEFGAPPDSSLRELTAETAREQATFTELQKAVEALTQIRHAAQVLFSAKQLASLPAKSVVENLKSLGEKQADERRKLDELVAKVKRLNLAGFEEAELQDLLDLAQEAHSHPRSKLMKKEGIQTLLAERAEALEALRSDGREKEKTHKEIDAELRRIVKRLLKDMAVEDASVELERRKTLVEEVLGEVESIQKEVVILETEEFSTVANRLDTFAKAITRIQEALKRIEEKDTLEQSLATSLAGAQGELAKLEPRHTRAKAALTVLAKLLSSDYKATYLEQVMTEHKEKLSTIFSRIHAPHEFKEVDINTDVLLRRQTGVTSPVCEISTGQRTALALSIFLSLNSSVSTRAPWLLFDEPVVHVDDLNILSFFDMLRDLVLIGNRQVFFTTANTRIADLFAKKFDFLGTEEFREFQFVR
jgi:chromosome segregation protein